jgi:signal transduction histidine kinase/ActR/RegA family two-component response regulator
MRVVAGLRAWRRRAAAWFEGHVGVPHKIALLMVALSAPLAAAGTFYWLTTERLTAKSRHNIEALAILESAWPAYVAAARAPETPIRPEIVAAWRKIADARAGQFHTGAQMARFTASLEAHPDRVVADGAALIASVATNAPLSGGESRATSASLEMLTDALPEQVLAADRLARIMATGDAAARLRASGAFDSAFGELIEAKHGVDGAVAASAALTADTEAALATAARLSDLTRVYAGPGFPDEEAAETFAAAGSDAINTMDRAWRAWATFARTQMAADVSGISSGRRAGAAAWLALIGLNAWLAIALARSIVRPQRALIDAMHRLAAGDAAAPIPYRRYSNETGATARTLELLRKTMIERRALESALEEERRVLERRVAERTRALENANSAKTNFVATLSHEIRTPLNGVLGMAAALERTPLNGQQREMVKVVTASGDVLVRLLNNAIDISRIESGKAELDLAPFDLGEMVEFAASLYREAAGAKKLWLDVAIAPEAAGTYRGDGVRLRQIVQNFVSNAVKFTDRGGVSVEVYCTERPDGLTELVFDIADTGIGLDGDPGHLFERYDQGELSPARRFGGSGLGLAISKDLATLMGGAVFARSREGGGAVFSLTIALARLAAAPPVPAPAQEPLLAPRGLRALAADDNAVNLLVLRTLLEQLGVHADFVTGGRDALEAALALPYDLLILDIRMPDLDGLAVTRAVRGSDGPNRNTPVIAVSGDAMPEQIAKHFAAGVNAHVAKPIQVSALVNAIAQVVAREEPEETRVAG